MPDKQFDILIDIQARVAAIDEAIAKVQQLNGATQGIAQASESALSGGLLGGLVGGAIAGAAGAVVSIIANIPQYISQTNEFIRQTNDAVSRQEIEVAKAANEWQNLAEKASKIGDVAKLSDRIATDLEKASAEFNAWRTKELGLWQTFIDTIARQFSAIPGFGPTPNATALAEATAASRANLVGEIQAQASAIDRANRSVADWQRQQQDLQSGIPEVKAKVEGLTAAIAEQEAIISAIAAKGSAATDLDLHNAVASASERDRLNGELAVSQDHLDKLNKLQEQTTRSTVGERVARREINTLLLEDSELLKGLRAQEQLINDSPFLGADEKQIQLHQLYIDQQSAVAAAIKKTGEEFDRAYGTASQADLDRIQDRLRSLGVEFTELGYKIQTSTFTGQFGAELVQWVNSFGSAAHAAAQVVTGTLNTAIGSTSQALTGLIFQTGNWRQTFAQAAQSIVQNIIQIVLQYTIGRAIMAAINASLGASEGAVVNKQAAAAAKAWAPAAIAASIASYGIASGAGVAAFLAAEVIGTAAAAGLSSAGGGFLAGGYTGSGDPSEIAGVVHRGEFVLPATYVSQLSTADLNNLTTLVRAPRFEGGGFVSGGGGSSLGGNGAGQLSARSNIKILNFVDMRELMAEYLNSTEGEVHIIRAVNKALR